jgi:hypothetical protein
VDNQLQDFIPIVDKHISDLKTRNPEFKAERISKADFGVLLQKGLNRMERHKSEIPSYKTPDPVNDGEKPISASMPLNQILYGPPGTGKTYKLKEDFFELFTIKESAQSREQFLLNFASPLTWWQVITLVLLDLKTAKVQEIFDHELIKVKSSTSASKSVRATIWGQLQAHTLLSCQHVNYEGRTEPLYFEKNERSQWSISAPDLHEKYPEAQELYEAYINHEVSRDTKIKNYEFVTFHQSFAYEDFIEGIKPVLTEEGDGDLKYAVQDGVFKRLAERARRDPENKYALFIDEINRGNVSAIFGELITLIEDTKRAGMPDALELTLPYSKDKFSVPPNLYIIGTMNTADRSVEALDTALRRRFSFEEMLPDIKELHYEIYGYTVSSILETINKRIEKLLDRDHCIGHAYFLHKDEHSIIDSFYRNIIPLLQEYFFGDYGKIGLVLGNGFVRKKLEGLPLFADFDYEFKLDLEEKPVYEIIDHRGAPAEDFVSALAMLMKNV